MQWKTIHCMPKYRKELTPLVAFVGTFIVCYVSSVIIAGCKYTKFLC